jgi:twitching motility protein PilT
MDPKPEISNLLTSLLGLCASQRASDLHLSAGLRPYLRIQGQIAPIEGERILSAQVLEQIADRLISHNSLQDFNTAGAIDFLNSG